MRSECSEVKATNSSGCLEPLSVRIVRDTPASSITAIILSNSICWSAWLWASMIGSCRVLRQLADINKKKTTAKCFRHFNVSAPGIVGVVAKAQPLTTRTSDSSPGTNSIPLFEHFQHESNWPSISSPHFSHFHIAFSASNFAHYPQLVPSAADSGRCTLFGSLSTSSAHTELVTTRMSCQFIMLGLPDQDP
jgi:tellurite resistance protein TehA-like permease